MQEGGDCPGLRRVDAREEETRAVRGRGLPGEGGLWGREGQAAGGRISSRKTLCSSEGPGGPVAVWAWLQDGATGPGWRIRDRDACPCEELCLPA